jgi:Ca-activated chloride channel homolog
VRDLSLHPFLAWVAPLLPLLVALLVGAYLRRRARAAAALADAGLLERMGGGALLRSFQGRAALLLAASALLGLALADPRWGASADREPPAAEIVLVLDASNSMLARDAEPDRLSAQRRIAAHLVEALPGNRYGIVAFAGSAYVLAPLTRDRGAIALYLEALTPDMVPQTGSSAAAAITQGLALLGQARPGDPTGRALVLVSDGEVHGEEDAVLEVARRARSLGVALHTVGVGTPAGGPVPDLDPASGEEIGWKREPASGEVAVSRLDRALLERAAAEGGGGYHEGEEGAGGLAERLAELRGGRAGGVEAHQLLRPRFHLFALPALLLLGIEARRGRGGTKVAAKGGA